MRHGVGSEEPPEGAARGEREPRGPNGRTPMLRRRGPGGKTSGQQHLKLGADRLGEDGRRAVGGNANDQGRAVDDGAEGEVAEFRFVDDVDWHALLARGVREGSRVRVVRKRADGDSGGFQIARDPRPLMQLELAAWRSGGQRSQLQGNLVGIDIDVRAGGGQQLRLPRRGRTAASQHCAFAGEREEDRQARDRLHAARANFNAGTMRAHEQLVSGGLMIFSANRFPTSFGPSSNRRRPDSGPQLSVRQAILWSQPVCGHRAGQ